MSVPLSYLFWYNGYVAKAVNILILYKFFGDHDNVFVYFYRYDREEQYTRCAGLFPVSRWVRHNAKSLVSKIDFHQIKTNK